MNPHALLLLLQIENNARELRALLSPGPTGEPRPPHRDPDARAKITTQLRAGMTELLRELDAAKPAA